MGFLEPFIGAIGGKTTGDEYLGNKEAQSNVESIDKQIELLNQQKKLLQEGFASKRGLLRDQYGNLVEDVREKFALSTRELSKDLYKMGLKTDVARSRSGLAYSGTVETMSDIGRSDIYLESDKAKQQRKTSLQTLEDKLGMNLLDLTMSENLALNQIDVQMADLEGEKKVANQEKKWWGIF